MKSLYYCLRGEPKTLSDWAHLNTRRRDVEAELHLSVESRVDTYGLLKDFTAYFYCSSSNSRPPSKVVAVCSTCSDECPARVQRKTARIADRRLSRMIEQLERAGVPVSGSTARFVTVIEETA